MCSLIAAKTELLPKSFSAVSHAHAREVWRKYFLTKTTWKLFIHLLAMNNILCTLTELTSFFKLSYFLIWKPIPSRSEATISKLFLTSCLSALKPPSTPKPILKCAGLRSCDSILKLLWLFYSKRASFLTRVISIDYIIT